MFLFLCLTEVQILERFCCQNLAFPRSNECSPRVVRSPSVTSSALALLGKQKRFKLCGLILSVQLQKYNLTQHTLCHCNLPLKKNLQALCFEWIYGTRLITPLILKAGSGLKSVVLIFRKSRLMQHNLFSKHFAHHTASFHYSLCVNLIRKVEKLIIVPVPLSLMNVPRLLE